MKQKSVQKFNNQISVAAKMVLAALILFCATGVQGQSSTAHRKSSNAYRDSYQRLFSGSAANFAFEIKADGTLWACGENAYGNLGDNTSGNSKSSFVQVGTATNWKSIAVGEFFATGIQADGSLWAWGRNNYSQLGLGNPLNKSTPTRIGTGNNWIKIASGSEFTMAIKADGTLWAWGRNDFSQLGDGTTVTKTSPTQVGNLTTWASVSCGLGYTIAIKTDGTLWAWGRNHVGQLGNGTTAQSVTPTQIGTSSEWKSVSAGETHILALKANGTLWAWGANNRGQIGNNSSTNQLTPLQIGTSVWAQVSATRGSSHAISPEGTLWAWGENVGGQLGTGGSASNQLTPIQVGTDNKWTKVTQGYYATYASKCDGTAYSWGSNFGGQLGNGTTVKANTPGVISNESSGSLSIAAGYNHTATVNLDGTLWVSGDNQFGQLGIGNVADKIVPTKVGTSNNWVSAIAANFYTIALKNDGTLWAWGLNTNGQLGDGTTANKLSPVQIGNRTNWASITAGRDHTLALKADGTLWAWGNNANGRLGDNTSVQKVIPTQIGTDADWVSVIAGADHSMALKSNGTIWAWGFNNKGQLGIASTTATLIPTQIGTDNTWVCLGAGATHSLGIKANGTLFTWGNNATKQIGDGTTVSQRTSPVQIGTDNKWTGVAGSYSGSGAIKSDGTLWAWGGNTYGEYGNGGNVVSGVPVQVTTQNNVIAQHINSGGLNYHTSILKAGRTSVCLSGYNSAGQLGSGTLLASNVYNCVDFFTCTPATQPTITQTDNGNGSYTLTIATGQLNNNTTWVWSKGTCGGTAAGTGTSITVTATDTYFVRGEGGCAALGQCSLGEVVNIVLPVTLLSFDVKKTNSQALVEWKTASEVNNHHFQLLKATDGINFLPLATVKPQTKAPFNYFYNDANVNAGLNYYRLLQVDNNGKTTILGTKAIHFDFANQTLINVYPNPASEVVNIDFKNNTYTSVEIISLTGKIVAIIAVKPGQNKTVINTTKLAKGVYILQLKKLNGVDTKKIIIQ